METPSAPPVERGWVRVSNIAPTATQEEIVNLFGFCGYVSGISIHSDKEGEHKTAIVEFWDKNAAVTACLLSSALIQNQPITVELYIADANDKQKIASSEVKSPGPAPVDVDPAARQTRTATIARVLASGIVMAKDVGNKAIDWDNGHLSLFQKAEIMGLYALSNIEQINEKYHITEKAEELMKEAEKRLLELKSTLETYPSYQTVKTKALDIDSQYGISATAMNLLDKAKTTAVGFRDEVLTEVQKKGAAIR